MQSIRARQRLPDLRPQLRPAFIHPGSEILNLLFSEGFHGRRLSLHGNALLRVNQFGRAVEHFIADFTLVQAH